MLDNYYLPGDLERQIGAFVEHYNHVRYHESIENLTPADGDGSSQNENVSSLPLCSLSEADRADTRLFLKKYYKSFLL